MKRVYCVQDGASHWYVIPYDMKEDFLSLLWDLESEVYDYDLFQEFNDKYGKYHTGGDLNLIPLYIDEDQLLND